MSFVVFIDRHDITTFYGDPRYYRYFFPQLVRDRAKSLPHLFQHDQEFLAVLRVHFMMIAGYRSIKAVEDFRRKWGDFDRGGRNKGERSDSNSRSAMV